MNEHGHEMTPDDLVQETAPAQTAGPAAHAEQQRAGRTVSSRQAFIILAIVLAITLVGLVIYLLLSLRPHSLGQRGGQPVEGIAPLFTIEGPGTKPNPTFKRPLGVAFAPNGRIYVSDTGNNRICVFDANGGFLREWGGFGVAKPAPGGTYSWKPGRLNFPDGVSVDENGDVYVADFRNDSIEVFNGDGAFLRRFPDPSKQTGKGGSGQDGKGIAVTAVCAKGGKVYATDTYQVFVFSSDGTLLRQFGKPGSGPGDLDHPNGIAVADDGTIYVSDSNHARITAFDPDGKVKWNVGRIPGGKNDTSTSDFQLPRGIAVGPDASVYVIDVFGFDIVKVSPRGTVLGHFGTRGTVPAEFNFPNAISVVGNTLAVADKENDRVQVVKLVSQ